MMALLNKRNPNRLAFPRLPLGKKGFTTVITTFLTTRFVIFLVILFSSTVIPMKPNAPLYAAPNNLLLDGLIRFDSWWYYNIITQGYNMGDIATGQQGNVAFFPLYPMLVKMMTTVTGNVFIAGVLLSNITFLFALGYLYTLTKLEFDEETASRTIFYFAAAPTAVFFSAMYTESLYLLLVIATFYYARIGGWGKAALAGLLAAATRNTGILLTAVIALEGLHQAGFRFWPTNWQLKHIHSHLKQQFRHILAARNTLLISLFVPLGLIGYMAYLANTFGDPLGFIHVQETWGRSVSAGSLLQLPSNTIRDLNLGNIWLGEFNTTVLLDTIATLGFGFIIIGGIRHLRPAHILFVGLTFIIPLSTGTVTSMSRYILMLVPCFMILGHWGRHTQLAKASIIFPSLMIYNVILFSHWYFVG